MAYERRHITGIAVSTTLNGSITSGDTSFSITSATGWPSGGASGDFFVRIESEVIRCSSRTTTTVTVSGGVAGRGYDGTSAASHASGVATEHIGTKTDLDEANYAVSKTVGKATTIGDTLYADAANSLTRLAIGTSGQVLASNGTIPGWAAITVPDGGVSTTAKLVDDVVTYAKIQNVSATDRLLGRDTAGAGNIEELTVGGGLAFTGTGIQIATDGVTTAKILDENVTAAKLDSEAASHLAAWTSWVVDWSVLAGTTPDINSGALMGYYKLLGETVHFQIHLKGAADTVWGSGANVWIFSLPVEAENIASFGEDVVPTMWWARDDNTTTAYAGFGVIDATTLVCGVQTTTSQITALMSNSVPFTWATNDTLVIKGTYEGASV